MSKQSYYYNGCKFLRCSKMCFELEDQGHRQFVFFRDKSSYYDAFHIEGKNNELVSDETRKSLRPTANYISDHEGSAGYGAYDLRSWGKYINGDPSFIEGALKDMKASTNPRYIGNYCVALLCEIAKLPKIKMLPYIEALTPYLDKTTDISGVCLDDYVKEIEKTYQIPGGTRRPFFFALAKAPLNFYALPYIRGAIENELKKAISAREEGLEEILGKFPIVEAAGSNADFLYAKYKGLGMKPTFRILYMVNKGYNEDLYQALLKNPYDFKASFEDSEGVIPLELFRYLASHGYEDKKKELAKALMPVVKHARDYFALRVFLSDEEMIEIYKNKPRDGGRWGEDRSRILPIALDKEPVRNALKTENVSYYYTDSLRLASYVYEYGGWKLQEMKDYEVKDIRKELRSSLSSGRNDGTYVNDALGLVAYGDNATQRYFLSEFEEDYHGDPRFALVKAYIGDKQGKKVKDSYLYPEGK